jgi:hypothetical protein
VALTNAQRQAKHRAKHVKLSAELANTLHVALIRQHDMAIDAGDWYGVATMHEAEAGLYEAAGNDVSAATCKRLALRAWIRWYDAEGDTEAAERGRAILARMQDEA